MRAIRLDFDPNRLSCLENLVLVLEFIYDKSFYIKEYVKGEIPDRAFEYLEEFKYSQKLGKEKGLTSSVIQRLNQVWIEKKYAKQEKAINNLHTWLIALEYDLEQKEVETNTHGKSTFYALKKAQELYKLPVTGRMTVELEERLLKDYNALNNCECPDEKEDWLQVIGVERLQKVVAPLNPNDKGENVQHLQVALAWLGEQVSKSEYREALWGTQTKLAVINYQKKHSLEASGTLTVAMAEHINQQLLVSKPTLLDDNTYRVRGEIKDENWQGVEAAIVEVYEQLLRGKKTFLGKAKTNKEGAYELIYKAPYSTSDQVKENFHLSVHLKDRKGTLLEELTFFNVSKTTWANYTASTLPYQGKSLYEENIATLSPHLSGLKIEEIEESDLNKDIEYLNASSGLGGNEIMLLSLAHRIVQEWGDYRIDPSVVYAFFKQYLSKSLPSNLLPDEPREWKVWIKNLVASQAVAIALIPREQQEAALQNAMEKNLLPIEQYNQLKTILNQLDKLRLFYAENAPIVGTDVALKDILQHVTDLPQAEKNIIVTNFAKQPNLSTQFIQQLGEQELISASTQKRLQQEYLLFELGNKELTATNNLKKAFYHDGYSEVIRQTSDFAKWSVEDWHNYVSKNEDTNVTAKSLYDQAIKIAPTVATLASLKRSKTKAFKTLPQISQTVDEKQWLDLMEVPLLKLERAPKPVLSKEVFEELKTIQRVQKISDSPETATTLMNGGVASAQQAFRMGEAGLAKVLLGSGKLTDEVKFVARQVYLRAQHQVGMVLGLGTLIKPIGNNSLPTNVLNLPQLADIEDLFGTIDTCACTHCRSVYSPAAYLTDLLQWLSTDLTVEGSTSAVQPLLERRPDLEHILLNCKNATTPLPYIDLVNEVLEYAIGSEYLERNTTWTAEALRIQGEYESSKVYEGFIRLSNDAAYKPVSTYNSFNLWQSKFHLYLEKLGIDSFELVQSLGRFPTTTRKTVAEFAAYFKMPSHEVYDLITNHYDYSNHPAASNNVEQFLKHHKISYEQLVELLQCQYANPNNEVKITPVDSCTLADKVLQNLNSSHYNKIWDFLRLWRFTGWSLTELDLAIQHPLIGGGGLQANNLNSFVQIHQLQHQLNCTLEECLIFFSTMNGKVWITAKGNVQDGLYQRTYTNPTLEATERAKFNFNNIQVNLQTLSTAEINYIAAALGTNVSTVQQILTLPILSKVTQVGGTTVAQASVLEGLTNLYAYNLLANTLQVDLQELVETSQYLLAGTNVVQNISVFQSFLEEIRGWNTKGVATKTVDYLARYQNANDFLSTTTIEKWHQELYTVLDEAYDNLFGETKTDEKVFKELLAQTGKFPDNKKINELWDILQGKPQTSFDPQVDVPVYFDYISTHDQTVLFESLQDLITSNNSAGGGISNPNALSKEDLIVEIKYHLHKYLNKSIVYDYLSSQLNATKELLEWSLEKQMAGDRIVNLLISKPKQSPVSINGNVYDSYRCIHRLTILTKTLELGVEDLSLLQKHASALQLVQPTNFITESTNVVFSVLEWNRTQDWWLLCQQYHCTPRDLLTALDKLNNDNDLVAYLNKLASLFGWNRTLLVDLQAQANWQVADYFKPKHYENIAQQLAWTAQLQEQVAVVAEWPNIFDSYTTDYLQRQKLLAKQVEQSLQKAVAPAQWGKYQEQVQGQLRQLKRDALVAYASHYAPPNGAPSLLSVEELYKYYLIDPGMSACQYTSRIKQAISSVQLYIQRCLMGLENAVDPTARIWGEWKWRKNYRVWEANRKVFLYPENWIEPGLRDNKTELFKQFEDQLLQGEITNENVEKSLQDYLVKLHDISNLEIKSICQGDSEKTVYVLARTRETPANYYYRKLDKEEGSWTGWEKIDATVKGEHPVLQYYNGRLHLFWLEILEKPQKMLESPDSNVVAEPINYKEIQLGWAVLYENGWSAQVLSKQKLIHPWPRPNYSLHLRPRTKDSGDLWLDIYVSTSQEFNEKYFYNQHTKKHEKLTHIGFDENSAPTHSSSFIFNGFVRDIKVKPIKGTYWYVDWDIEFGTGIYDYCNTSSYETIRTNGSGAVIPQSPVWVEKVIKKTFSGETYYEIICNYEKCITISVYKCRRFNQNIERSRKKLPDGPNKVEFVEIVEAIDGAFLFKIRCFFWNSTRVYTLTREEFNSYLHEGNFTSNVPRPYIKLGTFSEVKFIKSKDIHHILAIDNSNEYDYIYHSFGEEGRQIKKMTVAEAGTPLEQIRDMHHAHNVLTNNSRIVSNKIVLSANLGLALKDLEASDWKLLVPMEGTMSVSERYQNRIYQDDFRSFYLDSNAHLFEAAYGRMSYYPFYHPHVRTYLRELGSKGLNGIYQREVQLKKGIDLRDIYDYGFYSFGATKEQTSFIHMDGYAIYNWELFFHIPLLVATELSKNQRFEEAMQWFHYIFDPKGVPHDTSANSATGSNDVSKYWITKPFFQHTQSDYQNSLIQNLLGGTLSQETKNAITNWRKKMFQPHAVARLRPVAYQKAVVMKYLDNLIAWGDQLYRRETLESINQAALRYMVAAEILGDIPEEFAGKKVEDKDFASVKTSLDAFSNANVQTATRTVYRDRASRITDSDLVPMKEVKGLSRIENAIVGQKLEDYTFADDHISVIDGIYNPYFCIPKNEKLASYWDTIRDRLFKIRHCMNIDGIVRHLPLFAPPIDPALLVQAQANGVDLDAVLNGTLKAKSHYKYRVLARLAVQFCGEVKSLGQSLLSALQSKDAEGMALLQSSNTIKLLNATVAIKQLQIQEAEENIKSLELSKTIAEFRKDFYSNRKFMNAQEKVSEQLNKNSLVLDSIGLVTEAIAAVLTAIPRIDVEVSVPPAVKTTIVDGLRLSEMFNITSGIAFRGASVLGKKAGMAATQGSYRRRQEEWDMQAELAAKDIEQINQQIAASQIRVALAKKDLEVHQLQIDNANSEREYLQSKYTNKELYSWMVGQISKVYYQAYELAYDMAKQAESSMRYELSLPDATPTIIRYGYWDSMKKGLLAGDKLMLAINRMEALYVEKNTRDLELTKHLSLHQLSPTALLELKLKGECTLTIPEWWFDIDYPGHYMRRIKALSVSIPCVAGPNTTVACTLTMTKNTIRYKDDTNKTFYQAQSIATSSGQNDAGVFELNFNGERFLPFEGAGVDSSWTLKLPEYASFDYQSITDVVLHMHYTAKDGGAIMAEKAQKTVEEKLTNIGNDGLTVLLSLKTAFPTAWHRFLTTGDARIDFDLENKHYPYLSSLFKTREIAATEIGILLKEEQSSDQHINIDLTLGSTTTNGNLDILEGNVYSTFKHTAVVSAQKSEVNECSITLGSTATNPLTTSEIEAIEDVFIILTCKLSQE